MMLATDIKKGSKVLFRDEPYIVLDFQHVKPGKGGAFVKTKMKNMITGLVHSYTYRSEERIETPDLEYRDVQYLYQEDNLYQFMDTETYEQIALNKEQLTDVLDFLKEQSVYQVMYFKGNPASIEPPLFMELKVVETMPGVRGDTAQGGATKPATLDTGLVLQVPLFINEGDILKVDTRDAKYVERLSKK
jgi:elongation factor P